MELIHKAISLMDDGNADEAIEILESHLEVAADETKFQIVELYYEWGFFDKAIIILENLLETHPDEGDIILTLAEMYIEVQNDERAIDLLNDIAADNPVYLQSLIHLADLYQAQGLFEVSEQKLLQAKKLAPNEIVIDFALGEFLFSIGQYNRAIPFYELIAKEQEVLNHISIVERLAEAYAYVGNYEEALAYYEQQDSKEPNTLFKYGFTAQQVKRNDIAITVWSKLVELDPHYHAAYYELAKVLKEEGRQEEAVEIVAKGISYDEFNKELFLLAAQIDLLKNDRAGALLHINRAIKLDSDYKEAILFLIQLHKDDGNFEEIITFLKEIKGTGATDPLYDWEEARAYVEEELYKEAVLAYQEASAHLMHDAEFLKEYGFFLTEEGKIKEALEVLTNYLQIEPQDDEVISYLERLMFSVDEDV